MIVEHDSETRAILRRQLEGYSKLVLEAQNSHQALDILAQESPELIISDLMMPEMDGFKLVQQLHQNPQWSSIPIIILTVKELTSIEREQLQGRVKQILQQGGSRRTILLQQFYDLLLQSIGRKINHQIVDSFED